MRSRRAIMLAGLALQSSVGTALAAEDACSLKGDTIDVSYYFPKLNHKAHDAGSFTVAASDIDPAGFKFASINITENNITISYLTKKQFMRGEFNGYVFIDLTRSNISQVTINKSTTVAGVTSDNLQFTSNSITLNMQGLAYRPGDQVQLDVTLACKPPLSSALDRPRTS